MTPNARFMTPDLSALSDHFIVDMHHHTRYSHDSGTTVKSVIDQAKALDIYVAITDHNSIGGVLKAFETPEGKKRVIPGIEVCTKEKKDVLLYFYELKDLQRFFAKKIKPHLKQKNSILPNGSTYPIADLLHDTSKERCLTVLPHPCCARIKATFPYFEKKERKHLLELVDAIEVINETMTHKSNITALGWALSLGKPFTAGSDGHVPGKVGCAVTYGHAKNKQEFLDAVRKGNVRVQGTELKKIQRLKAALYLVKEKVKFRSNKRIDAEYA